MEKRLVVSAHDCLHPHGFRRQGLTWNRRKDSFVDVVEVQRNKGGDKVTANFGVLNEEAYFLFAGAAAPTWISEPICTVRARVGELIDGKDKWWSLDDTQELDGMVDRLTEVALPFFDRLHSDHGMEKQLSSVPVSHQRYPPPVIYLAILRSRLGDRAEACKLLHTLHERTNKAWKMKVLEVCNRLGCS